MTGSIHVSNLGKAYKQYPTRWSRLAEWMVPFGGARHQLKWVLRDINFNVKPGETVGIIGINGAGKSTLLKLITGTNQPTTGEVRIIGRVAALLELGMGFHPDFTGRQNAIMGGQLLGLSTDQISVLMPEIEAFAEIGEYIDQPVRVYSSGMMVRLAFSVATVVRPDILIIDEVLSVGDRYFSQKSLSRILDFRDKGTSLLFVSHDTLAVKSLCDRTILLHNGGILKVGYADSVIDYYNGLILANLNKCDTTVSQASENCNEALPSNRDVKMQRPWPDGFVRTHQQIDTGAVCIGDFGMYDTRDNRIIAARSGDEISFKYIVKAKRDLDDPHFGFSIRNSHGVSLFNTNSYAMGRSNEQLRAEQSVKVQFQMKLPLAPGYYGICIGVANGGVGDSQFDEYMQGIINVDVIEILPKSGQILFGGYVNLSPTYSIEYIK